MAKIKKIVIEEPCHEDWHNMSDHEKGKFCGSCEKVVHDVSSFSDKKLLEFIKQNKDACINALPSQIDRDFVVNSRSPLLSRASLALGLISLIASGGAMAQTENVTGEVKTVEKPISKPNEKKLHIQGEVVAVEEHKIKGTVFGAHGNTINEASIKVGDLVVNSNKLGVFNMNIQLSRRRSNDVLVVEVSAKGYYRKLIQYDVNNPPKDFKITLVPIKMKKGKFIAK